MRPRTPSFGSMSDIAAGPGSCAFAVRRARIHPAPLSPEASRLRCHVERPIRATRSRPSSPLRAKKATAERCLTPISATDRQRQHRRDRSIPWLRAPRGPLDLGQGSVDAEPRASGRLSTLSRGTGEEHRTGAALRCDGVVGRAHRSKPDPLTPPVTPGPREVRGPRTAPAAPPSSVAPFPIRGAFHRRVPRALLAHREGPATFPGALPPPGPASDASSTGGAGVHHPGAGQTRRRTSTSAIVTVLQHNRGSTDHPATGLGVSPGVRWCGRPCTRGARPAEPSRVRSRRGRFALASASPCDRSLGELCPDATGPGTSCRGIVPGPAGCAGARSRNRGSHEPASRRRASAARARAAAAALPRRRS